jgi:nucleotide-binding universal stress UspA family protein
MTTLSRPAVVVGYDTSEHAQAALDVAAEHASRRRLPLHLVHALGVRPYAELFPAGEDPVDTLPWRAAGEARLAEVAAGLTAAHPGLEVTTCVRMSSATVLLLDQSRGAELLVVGARGEGGFPGLTIGSVGAQVAAHALCPVLVVRAARQQHGPVVVGIDGSAGSERAIGFAFEQADARGVDLVALHAYLPWAYVTPESEDLPSDVVHDEDARRLVSESVSGWSDKYPDVQVDLRVRRQQPTTALVEASADAQLVVVGSRGLGGFRGLLLGSVSRSVLHHAACTVAVVRDRAGH